MAVSECDLVRWAGGWELLDLMDERFHFVAIGCVLHGFIPVKDHPNIYSFAQKSPNVMVVRSSLWRHYAQHTFAKPTRLGSLPRCTAPLRPGSGRTQGTVSCKARLQMKQGGIDMM